MSDKRTSHAPRILVADDDPVFTCLATATLSASGFEVRVAADGVEALHLLDSERFDTVLVDLSMPRIDGFRLIALIRGTPRLAGLPILVVTMRSDAAADEEALRLGAAEILRKPVDWKRLTHRLRSDRA